MASSHKTVFIPLSQGKFAIVDVADYDYLSQWKWTYGKRGYAIRSDKYGKHIWMHRQIINTPDDMLTDHINGNKLDNRRSNLRICTDSQNKANAGIRNDNTSGYKGVARFRDKWQAYVNASGHRYHLGHYLTKEEAARAYNKKAEELFGEFARLNSV